MKPRPTKPQGTVKYGSPLPVNTEVFDVCKPKRFGKIKASGPEVSEVKWDTGVLEYVSNSYLRETT